MGEKTPFTAADEVQGQEEEEEGKNGRPNKGETCIERLLESAFYSVGKFVAFHPWISISLSLIITGRLLCL